MHGEVRYAGDRPLTIHPGKGELYVRLEPVYLAHGIYYVTVTILDKTRKNTLLHWLHFHEIENSRTGRIRAGPFGTFNVGILRRRR